MPSGPIDKFRIDKFRTGRLTTGLTKMGVTQFLADKITNHTDRSIGAVYNRYEYEAEKRDALTLWDARPAEIVV